MVALAVGLCLGPVLAAEGDLSGVVLVHGRPVRNVVVWLEGDAIRSAVPTSRLVLDQRQLQFKPHVLAVTVGAQVEMPNSDRVFHNVFSFHDGKRFDLGLYPVGTARSVTFDRPGLSRIFCNIHPNMAAYVLAVDSVHYAVTDAEGRFTISGVAAGTYTYHAWRPGGQTLKGTVAVDAGGRLEIGWP